MEGESDALNTMLSPESDKKVEWKP